MSTEGVMTTSDDASRSDSDLDDGVRLLDERHFEQALASLRAAAEHDRSGSSEAMLGLVNFQMQRYGDAASHYAKAIEQGGPDGDWQAMLDIARQNADAEVHVFVPEIEYFNADTLLAAPPVPRLPAVENKRRAGVLHAVWHDTGKYVGNLAGVLFDVATRIAGKKRHDDVWTNWYRKGLHTGVLTLAAMRESLMENNLYPTYPPGTGVGFADHDATPPPGVTHFRTADGTWNRLEDPKEGAAGTRFQRNVPNSSIRPAGDVDLLSPNPRLISRRLLSRDLRNGSPVVQEVPFLNLLAASWIQFQTHDWVNHGENLQTELIEIPLDDDDPARRQYRQSTMFVPRSQPDPTRRADGETTPVTFVNEVTHWWDGSQIYGSDQATQDRLRSGVGGRLRIEADGRLPLAPNGVEDTGMVRNWWVGLSMLHTLFVREHNVICDRLHSCYPAWDDDRLFNVARLVNAAVMAKIHSIEWTPAILPNPGLTLGLNANWYGLLTYMFHKRPKRRTRSTFNVANAELGGLVGNHINRHAQPYGLAEEFVEVYRLHSLLPEQLKLRRHDDDRPIGDVPMVGTRQAAAAKLTARVAMADLFYSFGNQHPGQLVLHNYPAFMQHLSIPGNPLFDMGAVDILRARERGVPRYNEFRRQLGLEPIRSFDDLTDDAATVTAIKEVYGENVEHLDLLVGTLAEGHRPTNFGFGETMFQIFILNASRRLQADRFYTDDYREDVYTKEGMQWIDETSLKVVLLRHYPELAATGLANITNAFEPWDTSRELDPTRHPLRGFDPDLKRKPWTGDAFR